MDDFADINKENITVSEVDFYNLMESFDAQVKVCELHDGLLVNNFRLAARGSGR